MFSVLAIKHLRVSQWCYGQHVHLERGKSCARDRSPFRLKKKKKFISSLGVKAKTEHICFSTQNKIQIIFFRHKKSVIILHSYQHFSLKTTGSNYIFFSAFRIIFSIRVGDRNIIIIIIKKNT